MTAALTNNNIKAWYKQYSAVVITTAILCIAPVVIRFATSRTVTKTKTVVVFCQIEQGLFGIDCNW